MKNYFKASPSNPYHLSIGGIIFDEKYEKILCHHISKVGHVENIYVLMRESMEPKEGFEDTLHRGALEEFGAKVEIIDFVGSSVAVDRWFGEIGEETDVEKTTLYFICKIISQNDSKRIDDGTVESKSTLVWLTIDELISKMKNQFSAYKITNLDESKVLEKVKQQIHQYKK